MPPVIASASPPDISAIITSLGVFSLAVAAVVGGIYKGVKDIAKGGSDTGQQVAAAAIVETATLNALTESNKTLVTVMEDLLEVARVIERRMDKTLDMGREQREAVRAATDETRQLRNAVTDLHQHMRTRA